MEIELLYLLQSIFILIYMSITIIIGILITLKYFKFFHNDLLLIGISWMGLAGPFVPELLEFIIKVLKVNVNNDIAILLSILANLALIPFFAILWLIAFTHLLDIKYKMRYLILTTFSLASIIFEIILFYFYFTDLSQIGTFSGPFFRGWTLPFDIFLLLCILIMLITGTLFAKESLKSKDSEIKLKGKLLLIAFILTALGGAIDTASTSTISNIIARLILAIGSIMFYNGFILPNWVKNLFLKQIE